MEIVNLKITLIITINIYVKLVKFFSFGKEKQNGDECERLVKYDGKRLEISGLNVGGFQLGKFGIEPVLIQAVSHALMLLDASQYDLCKSIKGLENIEKREHYKELMLEDKLRSTRIYQALAALSMNPTSTQLQDSIKNLLLSSLVPNQSRAIELESSSLPFPVYDKVSENSLELENTSLKEKIENLTNFNPNYSNEVKSPDSTAFPSKRDSTTKSDFEDIDKEIVRLNQEYTNGIIQGLDLIQFWSRFAPTIQKITENKRTRRLIGSNNADVLDGYLINISGKIKRLKKSGAMGKESKTIELEDDIQLAFKQALDFVIDIRSIVREKVTPNAT